MGNNLPPVPKDTRIKYSFCSRVCCLAGLTAYFCVLSSELVLEFKLLACTFELWTLLTPQPSKTGTGVPSLNIVLPMFTLSVLKIGYLLKILEDNV